MVLQSYHSCSIWDAMIQMDNFLDCPARTMDRMERKISVLRKTIMVGSKMPPEVDVKFKFIGKNGNKYLLTVKGLYTPKFSFHWIIGMRRPVWADSVILSLEQIGGDEDEDTKNV